MSYRLQIDRASSVPGYGGSATTSAIDSPSELRRVLADNIRGDRGTGHITVRVWHNDRMVYRGTVEGLKHKKLNSVGNGESRHVRGRSTTLRNMAFVTIRKLPNGVVKITGRKMAGKRRKR